jgi:hypothetical protein
MQRSEAERDDWPKIGQYRLSTEPSEGASILVGGVEPIYVTRVESTHYLGNSCGMAGTYLGREQRRAFIAKMLGIPPEEIPWETDVGTNIKFTSLGQFSGAVLAFIEEQQQMYRATAKELEARGLLDPSEVPQSLPRMEVDLTDARWVDSDGGRPKDAEPISRDAIKLPLRVEWSE